MAPVTLLTDLKNKSNTHLLTTTWSALATTWPAAPRALQSKLKISATCDEAKGEHIQSSRAQICSMGTSPRLVFCSVPHN